MPMLAARTNAFVQRHKEIAERVPNGVSYELKKLYYDVANSTNPSSMAALMNLVPTTQMLFGSDFPPPIIAVEAEPKDPETVDLLEGCRRRNRPSVFECLGNVSENLG